MNVIHHSVLITVVPCQSSRCGIKQLSNGTVSRNCAMAVQATIMSPAAAPRTHHRHQPQWLKQQSSIATENKHVSSTSWVNHGSMITRQCSRWRGSNPPCRHYTIDFQVPSTSIENNDNDGRRHQQLRRLLLYSIRMALDKLSFLEYLQSSSFDHDLSVQYNAIQFTPHVTTSFVLLGWI